MKSFQEIVERVLLAQGDNAYNFCRKFDEQLATEKRVSKLTSVDLQEIKRTLYQF